MEEVLPVPEIFTFVEETAGLSKEVMLRTFNYGVGLALYVHTKDEAEKIFAVAGGKAFISSAI